MGLWERGAFGLLLLGCAASPAARPEDSAVVERALPSRVDLSGLGSSPGFAESTLDVTGQGKRTVLSWRPEGEPEALVVVLHGAVPVGVPRPWRAEGQTRILLECLTVPALAPLRTLVVAPRSDEGKWWSRRDTEFVLGLIEAAARRWPKAGRRRVVLGYSNGGIGAWYFARVYPQYFDAAVPIAANETVVGRTPLPVFAIHGENDEVFSIDAVRAAIEALAREGQDVTFAVKYRGTHMAPCSYGAELRAASLWLSAHAFR